MGVSVIVLAHLQQPLRLALLLKVRKFKAEKRQVPARVRACPGYFKARKNRLLSCAPIEPCAGIPPHCRMFLSLARHLLFNSWRHHEISVVGEHSVGIPIPEIGKARYPQLHHETAPQPGCLQHNGEHHTGDDAALAVDLARCALNGSAVLLPVDRHTAPTLKARSGKGGWVGQFASESVRQ